MFARIGDVVEEIEQKNLMWFHELPRWKKFISLYVYRLLLVIFISILIYQMNIFNNNFLILKNIINSIIGI
jgi:hypothetical protein